MLRLLFLFFVAFSTCIYNIHAQCTTSTVTINVDATSMLENAGVIKLTTTLSEVNSEDIHVSFKFDGTATFGTDYSFGPNEGLNSSELTNTDQYYIIIPAGEKSKTVNITGLDDSTVEQEETIEIEIGEVSSCGLIGSSSKRNLRINDDDLIISLSLVSGQDTVLEEEGSLKSLLQVSSNETLTEDVEVLINFLPVTASATDVAFTSTVKLNDGTSNSSPFDIYAIDDNLYEETETFYLTLSILSGSGVASGDSIAFSITDNDPPKVTLSVDTTAIEENGGVAVITIKLSRPFDKDSKVALNYEGLNSSALFDVDFESSSTDIVTISAGDTLALVTITAIDDLLQDPNENIVIQLNNTTGSPPSENISFDPQLLTIQIIDDENPPVAIADDYSGDNCVLEGKTLSITDPDDGLLANDYDPEGTSLTIKQKSFPLAGLVTCPTTGLPGICSDGTFAYQHQGDETPSGKDSFSYEITDGDGFTAIGQVTICVTPENDCPFVDASSLKINEGETATRDLTEGVLDPEYTLGIDLVLNFELVTAPSQGSATITNAGVLTYVAPDYITGSDPLNISLRYKVTDGGGCEVEDVVAIQINNTVPVAVADTFYVGVGQTINISAPGVLLNDPIPTGATGESYEVTSPTLAITSGPDAFSLDTDGSFTYTHDGSTSPKLDQFKYRLYISYSPGVFDITDGDVFIKVNDCPTTKKDTYFVEEGGTLVVSGSNGVLSNDEDINGDDITAFKDSEPNTKKSTVTMNQDGSFTYTHGGGEDNSDYFLYYANDGKCNSVPDTVQIIISPTNDCPIARATGYNSLSLLEGKSIKQYIEGLFDDNGSPLSIDSVVTNSDSDTLFVLATSGDIFALNMNEGGIFEINDYFLGGLVQDEDPENDSLIMRELLPSSLNYLLNPDGSPVYPPPAFATDYRVYADGTFYYEHDGSGNLRDRIVVEVCDLPKEGKQCCVIDSIRLFFGPDNACPIAATDYFSVDEGGTLTADKSTLGINQIMSNLTNGEKEYTGVLLNDVDEEGDTIWALLKDLPVNGVLVGNTINPDGSFTYVHDGSETNSDQFTYVIGDVNKTCSSVTVYININSVNECPVANDTVYTVDEGGTLTVSGLPGGGSGIYTMFPGIMGNDSDQDIGTSPTIQDNLIAYYPMNEYYDTIPGHDEYFIADNYSPGQVDTLSTYLVLKRAKELSSNYFYGDLKGGVADTLTLPNPPECSTAGDGKCASPAYLITYPNSPTHTPDRFQPPNDKQSYGFDGADSYVDVDHQLLDLKRSRYTISGWFRSQNDASETQTILNFTVDGKEKGLFIGIKDQKLSIGIGNGSGYTVKSTTALGTSNLGNQWYHFVFIKNEDSYKMYLNNSEIYSEDLDNSGLSSIPAKLLIGKSVSGKYFKGRIDDILILGDTVSQDEVSELYYGLSTTLANAPDDGELTSFGVDGSFTYVHNGVGGDPEDNFIYNLSDGLCEDLGKVTIIVNQINDCPVGVDDFYSVDEGGTLNVPASGILSNDTDEENDDLSSVLLDGPDHGVIKINIDGSFEYIHDDSETLIDSVRYLVDDGDINCSDTATVFITINPIPDCPVPVDDIYYVTEGESLTVDSCITTYTDPGTLYTNWAGNEPNHQQGQGSENYGEKLFGETNPNLGDGEWNDIPLSVNKKYLLEVDKLITSKSGHTYLGEYNGHSYFKSNLSYSWLDAKTQAEISGGYLAVIETKEEDDAISVFMNESLLIGLYQDSNDKYFEEPKGGWRWVDGSYLYNEGLTETLCGVILNDDDGGGDTIFVTDWTLPVNGTLENNEIKFDGKFTYNHGGSQLGDTIEYKIESDLCPSDVVGKIILIPINVNDCPIAARDTFYVDEGGTLDTLGILLNDYDDDGDLLRAEKDTASDVNHGTVQIFPSGRLLYTHDGSETLIDSVKYKSIDPSGCDSLSTIIIIVNPVNDLPVSEKDTFSVFEGDTLVVDAANGLLSNDTDADGDDLNVLIIKNVSNGTLIMNSDGSFTYIHDGTDLPNEVCFTYRSYDGNPGPPAGYSDETEVCITILNRVPICEGETYNLLEGEVLSTDLSNGLLSNCSDPDPQDFMRVILDIPPDNGSFVLNDDGTFTYDHDCSDDPDETFFTYFVTDGEDTTEVADTARIVIDNECPVGNDDLYSGVDEGGTLTIGPFDGVLSNDSDQNACDILEIKLLDSPTYGSLVLNSDGSFDYSHDDSENFIDEFTYLLNDGECSNWDTVNVSLRITPVPDTPPVAVKDSFECIDEGSFIQVLFSEDGVLSNDYDEDPGQTLRAVLVSYPLNGILILNPNGTFIYTHDGGESTSDSFTYYAVDDTGLASDTVGVSLCINPVNDCPIPNDDVFNINEGEVIDSSLVFNDFDVEGNDLLVSISSPPSIGGFTWSQDGKFTYSAPDDVPSPGPEIVTFDYILTDKEDGFVSCDSVGTVTIIINYENDCPITEDDSIIVDGSSSTSRIINVLDNDSDPDSQIDTTSVKIISGPTFGDAISNIDGTITYNYDESPIPFDTITYSVSDFEGCEVLGKVFIYVENLRNPRYTLPNYFTPNGDDFNDYFLIKYENILEEDLSFEVKIMDRYQRIVFEGLVQGSDKIWNGENSFTSEVVKTDFYYYEITPVEYYDTPYVRRRDKLLGTIYLEKER